MENYYSVNKFQIIIKREKGCRFKIPYMNEKYYSQKPWYFKWFTCDYGGIWAFSCSFRDLQNSIGWCHCYLFPRETRWKFCTALHSLVAVQRVIMMELFWKLSLHSSAFIVPYDARSVAGEVKLSTVLPNCGLW